MGIGANRARGRSFTLAIIRRVPTFCLVILYVDWARELCWSVGDIREEWCRVGRSAFGQPFSLSAKAIVQRARWKNHRHFLECFRGDAREPASCIAPAEHELFLYLDLCARDRWVGADEAVTSALAGTRNIVLRSEIGTSCPGGMAGGVERKYLHSASLSSKCPRDSTCLSALKD